MKVNYDEAIKVLLDNVNRIDIEEVGLEESYGRVIAEKVVAEENVPPFSRSPYDGYAFRAEDTFGVGDISFISSNSMENSDLEKVDSEKEFGSRADTKGVRLQVIENIRAGQTPTKSVTPGTAIRLMTGAPMPDGADAICKYEDTDFTDTEVVIKKSYKPGENVIYAGEDIKKGQILAEEGTVIDAGLAGTLASLGKSKVKVFKKVRAGIISTGDEVAEVDEELREGQIRNSNRYTISAALLKYNTKPVYLGHVNDDENSIVDAIEKGLTECDVLISTGGVSVGDYDLVISAMEKAGFKMLADGVRIKPGMASAYGVRDGKLMLALSGNPASSLTNLQCICMPALRKMAGYKAVDHQLIEMKLSHDFKNKNGNVRLIRGKLSLRGGEVFVDFNSSQGNVVISSAIGCDAYAIIPAEAGLLTAGELVAGFIV